MSSGQLVAPDAGAQGRTAATQVPVQRTSPRATRPRGALASCRPPVLGHSPLPESTKRGQPAPHTPHPLGTWNPRDTAPACASLLDPIRTCRGHSRPHVSVPAAADQLPPGPSTAPPANRAPGCDSEADAAPVPRGNRFANSERSRMPAFGEKLGLRNLRTPGQPARQFCPSNVSWGERGRADLRLSVDWQTELVAGAPTGGSTHERPARRGRRSVRLSGRAPRCRRCRKDRGVAPPCDSRGFDPASPGPPPDITQSRPQDVSTSLCCFLNHRSQLVP